MIKTKKALALILCMVMCLSMLPTWAVAEEVNPAEEEAVAELQGDNPAESSPTAVFILHTEPEGAYVRVYSLDENGAETDAYPDETGAYILAPGEYYYDVSAEGYQAKQGERIQLSAAEAPTEITVVLEPEVQEPAPEEEEAFEAESFEEEPEVEAVLIPEPAPEEAATEAETFEEEPVVETAPVSEPIVETLNGQNDELAAESVPGAEEAPEAENAESPEETDMAEVAMIQTDTEAEERESTNDEGAAIEVPAVAATETGDDLHADLAASWNGDYRYWNQLHSDYSGIRSSGCWIVSMAKMLYEMGVNRDASFNPDRFGEWEVQNGRVGNLNNSVGQIGDGGEAPRIYAEQRGHNITYFKNWARTTDQVLFNVNAGYWTIIKITNSAGYDHYVLIDNETTKATGKVYYFETGDRRDPTWPIELGSTAILYMYTYRYDSAPAQQPKGCVDSLWGTQTGEIHISGWAFDPDVPASHLQLHMYVGGDSGSGKLYRTQCNAAYRPDVETAYGSVGAYHGFDLTIPVGERGSQPVYVYAIDEGNPFAGNPVIGSKTINITADYARKITLNQSRLTLSTGATAQLRVSSYEPSDAVNKNVNWSSGNPSVATVDSNGKVTGKANGTATITATAVGSKVTATCTVTVNSISVSSVSLNKTSLSLIAGRSETLTASVSPTNATDKSLSWSSSNPAVATVSNGNVSAVSPGTAVITASAKNGVKASCAVQVLFQDVSNPSEYYYAPVYWAVDNGITTGRTPTTFDPYGQCTRGHIVTFLWRAMGEPEPSIGNPFTDVHPGDSFYKAVLWAYENGITTGKTPTSFKPYDSCTRGQIVTFLWRAMGEPRVSQTNKFSDVKPDDYYYYAVRWAAEKGITTGKTPTTFEPYGTCTRGQAVTFLYRAMN